MNNDHLSAMMAPLKEKYLTGLHDHRQDVCDFILHCKSETAEQEQCKAMHRRVHALASQGKAFGFDAIVHAALALQALLEREGGIAFVETAESAETLLRACDKVMNANHTEERRPE